MTRKEFEDAIDSLSIQEQIDSLIEHAQATYEMLVQMGIVANRVGWAINADVLTQEQYRKATLAVHEATNTMGLVRDARSNQKPFARAIEAMDGLSGREFRKLAKMMVQYIKDTRHA